MVAVQHEAVSDLLASLASDEIRDALNHVPVGRLPDFNRKLAEAFEPLVAGDPRPLQRLLMGVVLEARLAWADSYRVAVKEMEGIPESEWPQQPLDHRELFAQVRASA